MQENILPPHPNPFSPTTAGTPNQDCSVLVSGVQQRSKKPLEAEKGQENRFCPQAPERNTVPRHLDFTQ